MSVRDDKQRAYERKSDRKKQLAKHGLTLDDYDQLLAKQGDVCAACGGEEVVITNGRIISLTIDHCHTSGAVRGLLCQGCNLALGHVRDDIERLKKLITYLEGSSCRS